MDNKSITNCADIAQTRKGPVVSLRPRLSDTALVLLSTAANREGGSILPPPADLKTRGGALKAALARLLACGLIEDVPVGSDVESWRRGDASSRIGLRITATGRAAIGVEAEGDGGDATNIASEEASGPAPQPEVSQHSAGAEFLGEPDNRAYSMADPIDGTVIWTSADPDADVGSIANEAGPDADTDAKSMSAKSTSPYRRSKQDLVVALLSREIGVSIHALTAATGWLPHTVRAVLSGLRKKGYRIDRQKQDDGGSIYRIPPGPIVGAEPAVSDALDEAD